MNKLDISALQKSKPISIVRKTSEYIDSVFSNLSVKASLNEDINLDTNNLGEVDYLLNYNVLTNYYEAKLFFESNRLYAQSLKHTEMMYFHEIVIMLIAISFTDEDDEFLLSDLVSLINYHYIKSNSNKKILLLLELINFLITNKIMVTSLVIAIFKSFETDTNYKELNHSAFVASYTLIYTEIYQNYKYEENPIDKQVEKYFNAINIKKYPTRILEYDILALYKKILNSSVSIDLKTKQSILTYFNSIDNTLLNVIQKKVYNIFSFLKSNKEIDISNRIKMISNYLLPAETKKNIPYSEYEKGISVLKKGDKLSIARMYYEGSLVDRNMIKSYKIYMELYEELSKQNSTDSYEILLYLSNLEDVLYDNYEKAITLRKASVDIVLKQNKEHMTCILFEIYSRIIDSYIKLYDIENTKFFLDKSIHNAFSCFEILELKGSEVNYEIYQQTKILYEETLAKQKIINSKNINELFDMLEHDFNNKNVELFKLHYVDCLLELNIYTDEADRAFLDRWYHFNFLKITTSQEGIDS